MRTWTSSQLRVSPGRNRCRRNSPSLSSVYLKRGRSRGGVQDLKGCICIERATIFAETGERESAINTTMGQRGMIWLIM